jgi:hypothetical protein
MPSTSRQVKRKDIADSPLSVDFTATQNADALNAYCVDPKNIDRGTVTITVEPGDYRMAWAPNVSALYAAGVRKVVVCPARRRTARFLSSATSPAITWDNSARASAPMSVSAISLQLHNLYENIHRLSIAGAQTAGWKKNDRIQIHSQDRPEYSSTRFVGEGFRARTVNDTEVWVDGLLEFASLYATSIVARKLDDQIAIDVHGIGFAADGDSSSLSVTTRTASQVYLIAAVDCVIEDCEFDAPYFISVRMNSSAGCSVRRCTFKNGLNQPSVGQLTYGLSCYAACFECWMVDCRIDGYRHAFTTDGLSNASVYSANNWAVYGQPTWCGARNCYSQNSKGAPFDTHEEGAQIAFYNCHAVNMHSADESGQFVGNAFQVRCRRVTIQGCSGRRGNYGVSWKPYEHGTDNWLRVKDTVITEGTYSSDQSRAIYISTGGTLVNRPKLYLENVTIDLCGNSIESDLAVDIDVFNVKSSRPHRTHFDLADGCILRGRGVLWDSRSANLPNAATQNRVLAGVLLAGTAECHIDGLTHILGSDATKHTPSVFQANDTARTISAITKANPAVVTATGHGFSTGNQVVIYGATGMTQVNGRLFTVTVVDANSFSLNGVDSTAYGTYTGTAGRAVLYVPKSVSLTQYHEQDPSNIGRRPIVFAGQEPLFAFSSLDATVRINKAQLPAAGRMGRQAFVLDEAGGPMPAWDNGSAWKRFSDGATVS